MARVRSGRSVIDLALISAAAGADVTDVARTRTLTGLLDQGVSTTSPIELVEVVLPPAARVAYDHPLGGRAAGVSQQVWVLEGKVEVTVGDAGHTLRSGDCLAMRLDAPTAFHNPTDQTSRYLVALATDPAPPRPANSTPRRTAR